MRSLFIMKVSVMKRRPCENKEVFTRSGVVNLWKQWSVQPKWPSKEACGHLDQCSLRLVVSHHILFPFWCQSSFISIMIPATPGWNSTNFWHVWLVSGIDSLVLQRGLQVVLRNCLLGYTKGSSSRNGPCHFGFLQRPSGQAKAPPIWLCEKAFKSRWPSDLVKTSKCSGIVRAMWLYTFAL